MNMQTKQQIAESVRHFRLPRYEEIPNVGLYLEQVTKYISEYLDPIQEGALTASMISNYVKKHLIDTAQKRTTLEHTITQGRDAGGQFERGYVVTTAETIVANGCDVRCTRYGDCEDITVPE